MLCRSCFNKSSRYCRCGQKKRKEKKLNINNVKRECAKRGDINKSLDEQFHTKQKRSYRISFGKQS